MLNETAVIVVVVLITIRKLNSGVVVVVVVVVPSGSPFLPPLKKALNTNPLNMLPLSPYTGSATKNVPKAASGEATAEHGVQGTSGGQAAAAAHAAAAAAADATAAALQAGRTRNPVSPNRAMGYPRHIFFVLQLLLTKGIKLRDFFSELVQNFKPFFILHLGHWWLNGYLAMMHMATICFWEWGLLAIIFLFLPSSLFLRQPAEVELPATVQHCKLQTGGMNIPLFDKSQLHNSQGIDVWANSGPKPWQFQGSATLPRQSASTSRKASEPDLASQFKEEQRQLKMQQV